MTFMPPANSKSPPVSMHENNTPFHELLSQFFWNTRQPLIWIRNDRVEECNEAAAALFASDRESLLGRPLKSLFHPGHEPPIQGGAALTGCVSHTCLSASGIPFNAWVNVCTDSDASPDFLLCLEEDPSRVEKTVARDAASGGPNGVPPNFGKMLVDIFAAVSPAIDKGHVFRRCLELLGETFAVVKASLVHIESPQDDTPALYQWRRPASAAAQARAMNYLKDTELVLERLKHHDAIAIADTGVLTADPLPAQLSGAGVHAFLSAPIFVQNGFSGFIALEDESARPCWSPEDIRIVKTAAQILSAYLDTLHVEKTLRDNRKRLFQAQKMEALGTLVAGVAHEVNNPMNLILYNIDILNKIWKDIVPFLRDATADAPDCMFGGLDRDYVIANLPRLLSDADHAAERVVNIVAELKRFARHGDAFEKKVVQLNDAVNGALRLCSVTLKKRGAQIRACLSPDLPTIFGNIQSLEQIIVNLVINAAEAMSGAPGEVAVRTDWLENTRQVRLQVSDTGIGVDPKVSGRLFDPFVTTKQDSGGTGLGLSVTYNLVEAHGGKIMFAPNPQGRGTTFTVLFPTRPEQTLITESKEGIDTLTGCFSQGYINKRLPLEIKRAIRYRHHLSLILCEIRRAESVAPAAEESGFDLSVLKRFAGHIGRQIRGEVDWMARTDSGRFFITLPETEISGAERLAQRLHEELSNKRFRNCTGDFVIDARFGVTGIDIQSMKADISPARIIEAMESCLEKALQDGHPPVASCLFESPD